MTKRTPLHDNMALGVACHSLMDMYVRASVTRHASDGKGGAHGRGAINTIEEQGSLMNCTG